MATTTKKRPRSWCQDSSNRNVAERMLPPSENYTDITRISGTDPLVQLKNCDGSIFRVNDKADRDRITLAEYAHIIYNWLIFNPTMLSVSDYYLYPKDNAPYIYTLDEVIAYDSDEIYNLLQDRISVMMLRRQIDREAALALLREKYGWERGNETNINLNTNGDFKFSFGDNNITNTNEK